MKKLSCIFVLCLSICLCLGIVPELSYLAHADISGNAETTFRISNLGDLKPIITNFNSSGYYQNATFILENDIDFVNAGSGVWDSISGTIGTEKYPFMGTFDGNGHTIYNLSVDTSQNTENTVEYSSLFGRINGATIKNLHIATKTYDIEDEQFGGKIKLTIGKSNSSYISPLVAVAENSFINHVQIDGEIEVSQKTDDKIENLSFSQAVSFGGFAAIASNTQVSYCINKSSIDYSIDEAEQKQTSWIFDSQTNRTSNFGGIVGQMSSSSILFVVSKVNFDFDITENFVGKIRVGGAAGSVEGTGINSGYCTIINVGMKNSLQITNNSAKQDQIFVGEVCGFVAKNNAPLEDSIANVYYADNSHNQFGNDFNISTTNYVRKSPNTVDLDNINRVDGKYDYFENESVQKWHNQYGPWDFGKVFLIETSSVSETSSISLQNFKNDYAISFSKLDESIIKRSSDTPIEQNYSFSEENLEFDFEFQNVLDQDENGSQSVVAGKKMSDFYYIDGITLANKKVVDIAEENGEYYIPNGSKDYDVKSIPNGIRFIIKGVNNLTAGDYDISLPAKEFKGTFESRLYDEDGTLLETTAGYVYPTSSPNPSTVPQPYVDWLTYGENVRSMSTSANGSYSFEGWFLDNGDGTQKRLTTKEEPILNNIKFGKNGIYNDFVIYARYSKNACTISFKITEGIEQIEVTGRTTPITSDTDVSFSRTGQISMKITLVEGYFFDTNTFLTELNTYHGNNQQFCVFDTNSSDESNGLYVFILNMNFLSSEDIQNGFSISPHATSTPTTNNNWIWWVVGGVIGGLVVIALVVLLIVWLIRRKNGGFGGGKMKGYKNMYY